MREIVPATVWSVEAHRMADVADMIGSAFAGKDYKPMKRPGAKEQFEGAEEVDEDELNELLARFGGGDADGWGDDRHIVSSGSAETRHEIA
jgi:hypothetical protein